jgi:hypothetical protein
MTEIENTHAYYSKILGEFIESIGYNMFGYDGDYKLTLDENGQPYNLNGQAFICPLCCTNIYIDGYLKRDERDYLSFDHTPPKSVGALYKVPVCNACNSKFGSGIDFDLLREVTTHRFISQEDNSKIKGKADIRNGQSKASIELGFKTVNNEKSLYLKIPKTKGKLTQLLKEQIKKDGALNILFEGSRWERANLGLLKASYLQMFRAFGYNFIFADNAYKLRDIIFERTSHPLSSVGLLSIEDNPPFTGISLLIQPKEISCYLCTMPLTDKNSGITKYYTTALPLSGTKGWNQYLDLEKYQGKTIHMTGLPIKKTPLELGNLHGYAKYNNDSKG